jgi:hypothetical protein
MASPPTIGQIYSEGDTSMKGIREFRICTLVFLSAVLSQWTCSNAGATLVVPASGGHPFDIVVTASLPDQYFAGHTTFFFSLIVRPNVTMNKVNAFDAEFTDTPMRQTAPTKIFADPTSMAYDPADSHFDFDPSGVLPFNEIPPTPPYETSESAAHLAGTFSLQEPTEPYISTNSPVAHIVMPNDEEGTATIAIAYHQNNNFIPQIQATFPTFQFSASNVGAGSAVPEAGIVLFWVAASVGLGVTGAWRRVRRMLAPHPIIESGVVLL